MLYYTILYWETFDIEILLSQIIFFCTACSVDRAFGILFRKNRSIYRFYHILYLLTFYTLQIFLRSCFICSECRVISIYILRFTLRTSEWVLPFWAYPVKYIPIYFIYSILLHYLLRFVPYIIIFPHFDFALVTKYTQ